MRITITVTAILMSTALFGETQRLPNGLEFHVPSGWQVTRTERGAMLSPGNAVAGSEAYLIALLPGISDLQDRRLLSKLAAQYSLPNVQGTPVGSMVAFQSPGGTGYIHSYDFVENGQKGRVQFYLVPLRTGGVATVIAAGTRDIVPVRAPAVLSIATSLAQVESTVAIVPAATNANGRSALAQQWITRLSGKKLMQFSSYSSGSSGGYSSQKSLALAADGTYAFRTSSVVSVYVPGATGGSAGRNGQDGRWRIYEQNGQAMLELVPSQGNKEQIVLTTDGSKTFLNGHRWLVGSM